MDGDKVDQWSLIRDFLSGREFPPGLSIKIRRKIKRQARSFAINQASKLMYIGKGGCKAESEREVVVDPEERSRVLLRLHDENGHFGRNKTRSIISKHFYWPGMIEDIDQYVQFCKVCQRTGLGRNLKQRPPLHPIPVKGVWNQVGIDLVGPLQETPRGNRYLITMTDYFSKWSEAAPIKNKQADTVVAFIYSVFQRLGIPNHIITDQGREFNNELMTSLCAMTKCTHKITSAYHPQSNGVVKRFNQTIISGLQKVTNEHSDDWDTKIDDFLFAYRITIQDSTKHSPFEVMFNRQPNLPLDIGMSSSDADAEPNPASPNPASVSADSVEEIFSKMQNISKVVQGNVRQNIQAAQSRQKKHYDKQHVSQIDWNK